MPSASRGVLSTACMAHSLIHVFELSVPALLILIQTEFGAGDFKMGWVVASYSLLFGLGALPAGYLVDRWGSKGLLLACLWGSSLSLLGMALSPSLLWFSSCAACMGLCLSIYHPAGTALISHSSSRSGRVFAIHGMAGNIGVAGASVIAGVLGATLGWRWGLGLLAVLGLCLGLRVVALDVQATRELQRRPGASRWLSFVLLLVAGSSMGMVYRGVTTFLPKFFAVSYGSSSHAGTALGGLLTTAALLTGLAGMYAAGRMADGGTRPARLFLLGAAMQAPLLLLIGLLGGKVLLPLAMAFAFFHFFTQPSSNRMVADFTPPPLRGLGYGLFFFTSFGFGSLGAALGGWASERAGLAATFSLLSLLLLPSVLALLALSARPYQTSGLAGESAGVE